MKKEVQIYLIEFLKILNEKLPPCNTCKHVFQLGEDDRLWLWISVNDKFQSIIFDEEYDNSSPKEIVNDIINELNNNGYQI